MQGVYHMRIIMGRVHQGPPPPRPQQEALARPRPPEAASSFIVTPAVRRSPATRHAPAAHHALPRRAAPAGKQGGKRGSVVFVLLALAFVATGAIGLHLGGDAVGKTTVKAAALSAQMSFPQGGQAVAARELAKLRAWFGRLNNQSTASQSENGQKDAASQPQSGQQSAPSSSSAASAVSK